MKSQHKAIAPFNPFESLLLASSVAQMMLRQGEPVKNRKTISNPKSKNSFGVLQENVFTNIFSFLDAESLCTVSRVNALCSQVANKESLWQALFQNKFLTKRSGVPRKIVIKEINKIAQETGNWKIAYLEHFHPEALIPKSKVHEVPCSYDDKPKLMRVTRQTRAIKQEPVKFEAEPLRATRSKRGVKRSSPTPQATEPKRKRRRSSPNRATTWLSIVSAAITALAKETAESETEDERLYFTNKEICAYISEHWDELCKGKKRTTTWWHTVSRELTTNPSVFKSGYHVYHEYGYWTLHELDQEEATAEPMQAVQSVSS